MLSGFPLYLSTGMPSRNERMNFPSIQDPITDNPKKYILYRLTQTKLMASIFSEQEEKGRKAREKQNKNCFAETSLINAIQTDNVSSYEDNFQKSKILVT